MALQSVVDGHDHDHDHDHDHNDEPDLSNDNDDHDDHDADHTDLNDDHDHDADHEQQPSLNDQSAHDHALDEFLRPLKPDDATLYRLACSFSDIYRDLARTSDQQFLPTPVTSLPSGHETGRYLAIDVGGSNLRVAFIELLGDSADECSDNGAGAADGGASTPGRGQRRKPGDGATRSRDTIRKAQRQRVRRTLEKTWPIGEHLKMDKAEDLFAWIGDCIAEVVANSLTADVSRDNIPQELEMGITFSFPMMYVFSFPAVWAYVGERGNVRRLTNDTGRNPSRRRH